MKKNQKLTEREKAIILYWEGFKSELVGSLDELKEIRQRTGIKSAFEIGAY